MHSTKSVLVIGGGIAGAALAIALARENIEPTLVEKQAVWQPSSSGIFVYANGLAALDRIGVLADILDAGWSSEDGVNPYYNADGTTIVSTVYPRIGGSHVPPILGIKRSEMHRVLAAALESHRVPIRLGTVVEQIDDAGDHVSVAFSDGSVGRYDAVIGADGIRSATRTKLYGAIEPSFSGFGVWRSIHRKPAEITNKIMMMGVGKRLGIMPISNDMLYVFATANETKDRYYDPATLHTEMVAKFGEFEGPAAPLLAEIQRPEQVLYTAVEEMRLPMPWNKGRTLLIGDAAHASSPFMGQGGAMALEDAVVLAEMLGQATDIPACLAAFYERRVERCTFVQEESRKVGERGGQEDAAACVRRNEGMKLNAQAAVDSFYTRMAEPI